MTAAAHLLFWIALVSVIYVYVGYPLLLLLISAFVRRPRVATGYTPSISILIAAYNEAANIKEKIEQTLRLDYPADKLELVVLSDCSTDATDEIVNTFKDKRVRLLRMQRRRGKTNAQNDGVKTCKGEIIVFSDATTIYHPQALRYLAANYRESRVGAVSGRYQYFDGHGNSPTGAGTIVFWNYENIVKRLQSRICTITGCCGCIYSVRKAAYTPLNPDIISDLVQPLQAIRKGFRVIFEDRALAYEATTESVHQEFRMRVRVVTRAIRGILSVAGILAPWKHGWVSFQLFSHKIMRWMLPIFLCTAFLSNAVLLEEPVYLIIFGLQAAFYLTAIFTLLVPVYRWWRPLGVPLYFCTLNAAALVSIIEVLRGKKYVVWETVRPQAGRAL